MSEYPDWFPRRRDKLRRAAGGIFSKTIFEKTPALAQMTPWGKPERYGVHVERNIPYASSGEEHHLLDVYRSKNAAQEQPVVLYIHGGGFSICSKDTHFTFGIEYARRGFTVFSINYRLAPKYPFPAGLSDAASAYKWVVDNAHKYGGDVKNLIVSGESAGANFSCNIAIASAYERNEQYMAPVLESQKAPTMIMPACGYLDIENDEFHSKRNLPAIVFDRIRTITEKYRGDKHFSESDRELMSPLRFLEKGETPKNKFPPTFIACGGGDVIRHDSHRLAAALEALDVDVESEFYGKEPHAFHAIPFRKNGVRCWNDHERFIRERLQ